MIDDATAVERLLRLERMMTTAYDSALGKVNDARLVETLGVLRAHHQDCSRTLQQAVQRAEGGAPQLDGQFMRYVEEVLDTIDDAVRRDEAIGELRVAEAALEMTYGHAVEEVQSPEISSVVKQCLASEKEHLGVLAMAHQSVQT